MKIWWMHYRPQDEEKEKVISRPHTSKESAERDGLYHIITKGLDDSIDPRECEQDLVEDLLQFFSLIELGGYSQALLSYQALCKDQGWNDFVEIVEENVLEEADVPLFQALTSTKPAWDSAMNEFDRQDKDKGDDEEEDEEDDEDEVA